MRKQTIWTEADVAVLINEYKKAHGKPIDISSIANKLGRSCGSVKAKAHSLKITGGKGRNSQLLKVNFEKCCKACGVVFQPRQRTIEHCSKECSDKNKWKNNKHPRGMLGKKHTDKTKKARGVASKKAWANRTEEEKSEITLKQMKTRLERYGTLSVPISKQKVSWKQGWREIGGVRKFYRSRWEANYARYLQWLKEHGEILEWLHEPDVFWFDKIKRGVRSYMPDFKVTENNGCIVYHEVKGWMDARSKTKIKRMAKYHPEVRLEIIGAKEYGDILKKMSRIIHGWER